MVNKYIKIYLALAHVVNDTVVSKKFEYFL